MCSISIYRTVLFSVFYFDKKHILYNVSSYVSCCCFPPKYQQIDWKQQEIINGSTQWFILILLSKMWYIISFFPTAHLYPVCTRVTFPSSSHHHQNHLPCMRYNTCQFLLLSLLQQSLSLFVFGTRAGYLMHYHNIPSLYPISTKWLETWNMMSTRY